MAIEKLEDMKIAEVVSRLKDYIQYETYVDNEEEKVTKERIDLFLEDIQFGNFTEEERKGKIKELIETLNMLSNNKVSWVGFNREMGWTKEKQIIIKYPKVTLEEVKEVFHKWLYFTDDDVIDVTLAISICERLPGDPVWLFLIAPPGGCKTELIRSFGDKGDFYTISDLTSKTFISGLMLGQGEKRRKIEDLLPQLDKKIVLFKDFTTVLEKNRDERREIIAQLREIYDGSFSKKFGTLDKKVEYNARFGLIAGVTPIVDKHWKLMQQLGERFLKYRWNEDAIKTTRRANENEGDEQQMRQELRGATLGFITNLEVKPVEIDNKKFEDFFINLAMFIAVARTPVQIQDYRTDFYFDFIPMPERPTRLVKQLKKLSKALMIIRNEEFNDNIKEILLKIAEFTIPQDRLNVLKTLESFGGQCRFSQLNKDIKIPKSSLARVLQQMELLELIEKITITKNYEETIIYKVTALYPVTFTKRSVNVRGHSAGDFDILTFIKEQDKSDGVTSNLIIEACEKKDIAEEEVIDTLTDFAFKGKIMRLSNNRWKVLE